MFMSFICDETLEETENLIIESSITKITKYSMCSSEPQEGKYD